MRNYNDKILYFFSIVLLTLVLIAGIYVSMTGYGYNGFLGVAKFYENRTEPLFTYDDFMTGVSNRETSVHGHRYSRRGFSGGK